MGSCRGRTRLTEAYQVPRWLTFVLILLLIGRALPVLAATSVNDLLDSAKRSNNIVDYFHAHILEAQRRELQKGQFLLYFDQEAILNYSLRLEGTAGTTKKSSVFMLSQVVFTPYLEVADLFEVSGFAFITENFLADSVNGFVNAIDGEYKEGVTGMFFNDQFVGVDARFFDNSVMTSIGWLTNRSFEPNASGAIDLESDKPKWSLGRGVLSIGLPQQKVVGTMLADFQRQRFETFTLGVAGITSEFLGDLHGDLSLYRHEDMFSTRFGSDGILDYFDLDAEVNLRKFSLRTGKAGLRFDAAGSSDLTIRLRAGVTYFNDERYETVLNRESTHLLGGYAVLSVAAQIKERPLEITVGARYNSADTLRSIYEAADKPEIVISIMHAYAK